MKEKNEVNQIFLIIFLGLLAAMAPFSTDMYLPALPIMPSEFGVNVSLIQLTITMTLIGMAVGQLVIGPVSDGVGRKKPIIVGMFFFMLSAIGCVFTENIWAFLGYRFLLGFTGSAGIVISRAIARDAASGAALTRLITLLMMVNGLAPILSPVLGGQILLFTSWRGIFAVLAGIGLVLMLASFFFKESLPVNQRLEGGFKDVFVSMGNLLGNKYFMGHCLIQSFASMGLFVYISGSPFVFQNIYTVSAQVFSLIFGLIGIGLMINGGLTGKLVFYFTEVQILKFSLWQAVVGSTLLLIALAIKAHVGIIIALLFITISTMSAVGATSFSLAMQAHGKVAGSASALIGFFSLLLGGAMAPLVGINGENDAMPMAVLILIGEVLALVAFLVMVWPKHRDAAEDTV